MKNNIYATSSLHTFHSDTNVKVDQSFFEKKLIDKYNFLISDPEEIAEILSKFSGTKNIFQGIDTDIIALIVPLSTNETEVLTNIAQRITGSFADEVHRHIYTVKRAADFMRDEDYKIALNNKMGTLIHDVYKIKIFETYKYIQGDKFNNGPIGEELNYSTFFAEIAFNRWVTTLNADNNNNNNNHNNRK